MIIHVAVERDAQLEYPDEFLARVGRLVQRNLTRELGVSPGRIIVSIDIGDNNNKEPK